LIRKELRRKRVFERACYDAARVRILLDYRPALRQRTGVGQYVHELARAIPAALTAGDSLVLFSSSWKDRAVPDLPPGIAVVDRRIPVSVLNFAWHRLEWPPVEWLAGPVDVAHAAHPLMLPTRRAIKVVTIYDLDFLDHPERTSAEIRRDYPALTASHARRADLVVVISEHTAREVTARLAVPADRLVLCRPGAPPAVFHPFKAAPGPIVFIGTIEPRKNLPTLFEAYEQVVSRMPAAPPLVLAGRRVAQSAAILERLARMPALASRVDYRGYITDEDRQRLYAEASMLVLPSLEEGFGMTAVEAMQAGVPVIVAARGALPEVAGDAGMVVDPTRADDIAAAIERLLGSPEERRHRAEAGRLQAAQFSWSASAQTLVAAYREALARPRVKGRSTLLGAGRAR
jgi:glycosyltransferase involved in cell wall biosynthesis